MKFIPTPAAPWFLAGTLLTSVLGLSPAVRAQTATVTYDLNDVWLRPDISHPRAQPRQMTGTFVWTYPVGNFGRGTGKFVSLSIPWWGNRTTPGLKFQFELKAIEISMIGNFHGLGLDVALRLAPALSPHQASPIDPVKSKFGIEVGVSYKGHIIKGSIVPRCPPPKNYGTGSVGSGGLVPTITSSGGTPRIGNTSFRIDCARLLGGASCFLVLGSDQAQFQLLGVTVLIDPRNWFVMPLRATGSAGVPGVGALQIPMPIPNDPRLVGSDFAFQAVALDKGSTGGVAAATNGLNVVVCR